MADKDQDWHKQYSPNPDFVIGKPDNETSETARSRFYEYCRASGQLALFSVMYPSQGEREGEGNWRDGVERER